MEGNVKLTIHAETGQNFEIFLWVFIMILERNMKHTNYDWQNDSRAESQTLRVKFASLKVLDS